ncbi:unnamed protein product, partial [Gulo gulo]
PSPRNQSRCAGFRWELPAYPHLTTLLHSGSKRPEVWKSAFGNQLVPGHQFKKYRRPIGCKVTSMPG